MLKLKIPVMTDLYTKKDKIEPNNTELSSQKNNVALKQKSDVTGGF